MILVDLNQVILSNLMRQISVNNMKTVEEGLVRHMVLTSLRMFKNKFSDKYGTLVICCDDKKNWRKELFPYYKANRKKDRAASDLDWQQIFETINTIRDELKDNFPWRVLQVERAEADDIIGTLCKRFGKQLKNADDENILILSSDKDFMQLQKFANVDQYSPVKKQFLRMTNASRYLKEHIMKGDRGYCIPNFLSSDDTFMNEGRQRPIRSQSLGEWAIKEPEDFCSEKMMRGYKRNQQLVDLEFIPEDISNNINQAYDDYQIKKGDLLNYFIKHRLKNHMENLSDFTE